MSFFGIPWPWDTGGGYDGARRGKERRYAAHYSSHPKDEDRHLGNYRDILRLEGRSLDRNHGLLFGSLNRLARYSMPDVVLTFETDSDEYNREAEAFLTDWFGICDCRRLNTFSELCRLSIREVNLGGDGGFVLLPSGEIQPVESERIRTPAGNKSESICQGVETDALGRPVAFHVCGRDLKTGLPDMKSVRRIPAAAFVFFRQIYRFDSVRGIPTCASILPDLIDQQELHRYYLQKTKADARRGGVIKTEQGTMPANMIPADEEGETDADIQAKPPPVYKLEGLEMYHLANNEDFINLTPATPSSNITQYEEGLVRQMGSAIDVPYEFFMMDLRNLSWSTADAVIKMAGDSFRNIHAWARRQFISPVINWRLQMAISDKDIPPPPFTTGRNGMPKSQFARYRIGVPEYLWANEFEHLKGAKEGWRMGVKSLDDIAGERGQTGKEMLDRKARDIKEAIVRAQKLSQETGVAVSWDQLISASAPGETSLAQIEAQRGDGSKAEK